MTVSDLAKYSMTRSTCGLSATAELLVQSSTGSCTTRPPALRRLHSHTYDRHGVNSRRLF